ncbi:hypothetical protein [Thalassospira lohafexi]|uniref:Uncharacterized protein n=1 Tax=Thalassospira lohafexi TaxID=744227 RepID=A0A2N3LA71_9PROT|nr:hypothetical protein [Thalassospira lohafexi]PKR59714.1 hypothetical protein COO92_06765 [Thalassospira lohafexi]
METWIEQHATLLQVGVSVATLLIWIFYAQLLFQSYRRARRPKIVINQMLGNSDKARFLISNMSQEAIHIDKVLVCMGSGEDRVCELVTDADPEQSSGEKDQNAMLSARLDEVTLQGPLGSGKCIELGAFQNLLNRIWRRAQKNSENGGTRNDAIGAGHECRVEIIVMAVYSSEKGVIGASRAFWRKEDGELHPEDVKTDQYTGFFARRRMARLHSQYV